MTISGMDIEQVRRMARQMNKEAEAIEHAITMLTPRIEGAPWRGDDRNNFVGDWSRGHVPRLRNVVNGLRDAARLANRQADEQMRASN